MRRLRITKRTPLPVAIIIILLVLAQHFGWLEQPKAKIEAAQPGHYKVMKVNDGDTITIDMHGARERIRMIGVDTPETQDPRKPVQCFGKAATQFTTELIGTKDVRLEADPLNTNRDRYNRLLRYIYLPDNTFVNAEIIRQGYGFAYTSFPFGKIEEFKNFEKEAKEGKRGLWDTCDPALNDYGSYQSNNE